MKKYFLYAMIACITFVMPMTVNAVEAKDGDIFTSNTIEGVEMTFCIISESEKTCEVYGKYDSNGFLKPAFPDLEGGKITIPSEANGYKVIGVGHGAFNNCEILDSVFIPNTVTYIGNEAFIGCKNLVSADLPERLSSIGDGAFSNCTGLPAIIIPEGVITIGKSAFEDCYPVFAILPKTITSIGSQALAFRPAYLVSYMENPVDVDQFMFERLTSSTTILYIPKGTSAKYEAAGWTQFLKIKEIDEKLPESRGDQFYEITQEKIWINLVVTDTDLKTCELESVANGTRGKVIIPEIAKGFHITSMKKSIFKNTPTYQYNLTSVILPEGLKEIPDSAFYGCRNLYSVTIPESVKGIGHFAFTDCRSLEFVKIPESINSIGKNAFSDCLALSSVIIPKSITEISISTFQNCINLISVDLPESITEIGAGAFSQCTSLTDIKLPVNLTNIGSRGFINCSALKTILIPEGIKTLEQSVFQGCAIETIVIPEGVSRINKWAFSNCQKLDSIDISSTVTTIGNEVFYGSTPSVVTSRIQKPFTINANVFSNYSGKLRVPIGAKELYNKTTAWKNFSVIEEMFGDTIHATTIEGISMTFIITSEEEHTCMVCRRPSAPCIDANTEGQVTIPEEVNGYKVAIIGTESFIGCTKLTSVVIPSTVTNINDKAFTECANLTIVKSYVTDVFEISENVFQYTDENNNLVFSKATLFVPFGKVVDYLNKSAWNKFEIIEELDTEQVGDVFMVPESKLKFRVTSVSERTCEVAGTSETKQIVHSVNIPTTASRYAVTGIGRNAFYQFFYLKSIKIPSTVKYIGSGAFSITALSSVSIPESVESIGSGAFAGDSNLETVTLPRGLKTIASSTFTECGFTEITLPESLEVIEQEAFFKCKQLSRISIPSGVTEIQELAFAKCPSLKCVISHIPEPFAIAKDVFVESEEDYLNPDLTYNATLYVPEGTKEKYENQTAWNLFSKIIELGNSSPDDVNGDGTLSAVDILEVVNYILGNASDILNMDAADVNGDGVVNIADIVKIINIIMGAK